MFTRMIIRLAVLGAGAALIASGNAPQVFSAVTDQLRQVAGRVSSSSTPVTPFAMLASDGSPVRFPDCAHIEYVVNPGPLGVAGVKEIRKAVAKVGKLTGVSFKYAGVTSEFPRKNWFETGTPDSPAPVIIGWVSPDQTDMLASGASGSSIANPVDLRGVRVYSTGAVALNSEQLDRYEPGFGEGMTHGSLILHELGHLVGLGHTDAADSLMNPKIRQNGPGSFTSLDRANLAKVTLGRCPA